MSFFTEAKNNYRYARVDVYGGPGSGKTFTASEIAIGIHQTLEMDSPIVMFDTENASSFLLPKFQESNAKLLTKESRSLADLLATINEAEKMGSILIIDSLTHVWRDTQRVYLDTINNERERRNRPTFTSIPKDRWQPIKRVWFDFCERVNTCKTHVITCGRAGAQYDYQENEDNQWELISTGERMAAEKESGHEPSLLIHMIQKPTDSGSFINTAFVEKDRTDTINGQFYERPGFKDFLPHFAKMTLEGEGFSAVTNDNSRALFEVEESEAETYSQWMKGI